MPFIDGVGDELVYAALVAAPVVFICRSSLVGIKNRRQVHLELKHRWVQTFLFPTHPPLTRFPPTPVPDDLNYYRLSSAEWTAFECDHFLFFFNSDYGWVGVSDLASSTHPLNWLKHGAFLVRKWVVGVWSSMRGRRGDLDVTGEGYHRRMEAPAENEYCSICHDPFILPCQANCAHWFCGECILRVWQHTSALQPCKCPICRRPITLLIPSEVETAAPEQRTVQEIMSDIAKYNRIFGGGVVSLIQRVRDMPLLLRRLVREMMDPRRALQLIHRTPILFYLVFLAFYVFSPLDIIPEGIVGLVGFLDDILVIVVVLFYLALLYRSTLLLHHGGHVQ